jgi:hypothetical protein
MVVASMTLDYRHCNRFELLQIHQTLELVMISVAQGLDRGCKYKLE